MSSERASRALLAASDSLGQLAQLSWQKEQAQAQAEREENMLRLRQKLSNEELDKRQGFDVQNEESRFQHNLTAAEREAELRGKESKEERQWRERQARIERGWQVSDRGSAAALQRENWTRQDREAIERQALSQISTIDSRILDLRDAIDKGEYPDPSKAEAEVKRLLTERQQAHVSMIARLADMGDPRYQEVSAPPGGDKTQAPRAAQAPQPTGSADAGVDVTPPPMGPWERRQMAKRGRRALIPESAAATPDKAAVRQRAIEFVKSGRQLPGNIQADFDAAYGDMTNRELQSAWKLSLEEIALLRPEPQKLRR
jgi:hypothetical protein